MKFGSGRYVLIWCFFEFWLCGVMVIIVMLEVGIEVWRGGEVLV